MAVNYLLMSVASLDEIKMLDSFLEIVLVTGAAGVAALAIVAGSYRSQSPKPNLVRPVLNIDDPDDSKSSGNMLSGKDHDQATGVQEQKREFAPVPSVTVMAPGITHPANNIEQSVSTQTGDFTGSPILSNGFSPSSENAPGTNDESGDFSKGGIQTGVSSGLDTQNVEDKLEKIDIPSSPVQPSLIDTASTPDSVTLSAPTEQSGLGSMDSKSESVETPPNEPKEEKSIPQSPVVEGSIQSQSDAPSSSPAGSGIALPTDNNALQNISSATIPSVTQASLGLDMIKPHSNLNEVKLPIAYCVKCKSKKQIRDPTSVTMKNGRHAISGLCLDCGTKVFRIGGFASSS